jgi:hypothetical protein
MFNFVALRNFTKVMGGGLPSHHSTLTLSRCRDNYAAHHQD